MEADALFDNAFAEYLSLLGTYGKDHPDTSAAMASALSLAPASFAVETAATLAGLNALPVADGYYEDGSAVFLVGHLLEYLGMSPDQAISNIGESADSLMQLGVTTDGYFVSPEKICTAH